MEIIDLSGLGHITECHPDRVRAEEHLGFTPYSAVCVNGEIWISFGPESSYMKVSL